MVDRTLIRMVMILSLWLSAIAAPVTHQQTAAQILEATGVRGGLVVHVGCGDGRLTTALHVGEGMLVHGLDAGSESIQKARDLIREKGRYGQVCVEQWQGESLPYSDGVVNLLVAEDLGRVSMNEVTRVLCPKGVAYIKRAGAWTKTVKPWPEQIDEWTHYLYDATNNAVAKDERIATPNHLQWHADPKRTRDHDAQASVSALTSSNGRIFYILDEGPTSLIHRPAQWKLIARDAFNGKSLWSRNIDSWITHLHYFRSGPAQLPRMLVSVGDRVYVVPGFGAPVTALNAATGETELTYSGSEQAEEILCCDGVLLVVIGEPAVWNEQAERIDNYWEFYDEEGPHVPKRIIAYEADSGRQRWSIKGDHLARLAPLSLTAGADRVFYLDSQSLHCVDLKSGDELWDAPFPTRGHFLRNYAPTVAQYKDTVVCLSLERLVVFSIEDGRPLWQDKGYAGFASPGDLFVIDDLVWTFPGTQAIRVKPGDVPGGGKEFLAFDLYTGQVKKSLVKQDVWPTGHHHRCYRNKATTRYLISSRRGLEFVDLNGDQNTINWWVRGVCQYGFMPCNGLIYAPPHPCQCFTDIKFDGFHALAAQAPETRIGRPAAQRLIKGPAYQYVQNVARPVEFHPAPPLSKDRIWAGPVEQSGPREWPTYRHDITRSGCSSVAVPADLREQWKTDVGGKLSSVVVAQDRLLVSSVDDNTVICLDAQDGHRLWDFVANARVDSPATVHGTMAIFGCRDGHVYALRVSDGQLVWRFQAAPIDRRTVVRDRLESLWPVHGSVLVVDGTVYFCAGHSSYLDGGLWLYGLDATSGQVRCSANLHTDGAAQDGAMPDVLVSDGQHIVMRQRHFDLSLAPAKNAKPSTILSNAGFLEDSGGHRWKWNWQLATGDVSGRLLVFDETTAFGVQAYYTYLKHDPSMHPSTHTGHLHQKYARYTPEQFPIGTRLFAQRNTKGRQTAAQKKGRWTLANNRHLWNHKTLVQLRALVLADDVLFGAGWKDSVRLSKDDPGDRPESVLTATDVADGALLAEYPLAAEPVFDGMAAAYGRLYLSLKDGSIVCFSGK